MLHSVYSSKKQTIKPQPYQKWMKNSKQNTASICWRSLLLYLKWSKKWAKDFRCYSSSNKFLLNWYQLKNVWYAMHGLMLSHQHAKSWCLLYSAYAEKLKYWFQRAGLESYTDLHTAFHHQCLLCWSLCNCTQMEVYNSLHLDQWCHIWNKERECLHFSCCWRS